MQEIKYITSEAARFFKGNGGFLGLNIGGEEYARVSLSRAFPFSYADSYISVRDKEGKEIGIIEDLKSFPKDIITLLSEELDRRYLLPKIDKINSIKEEFGYSYWDVETDIGAKRFTIKKDNSSFVNVRDNRILIIDVDGNRYEIIDYSTLDSKSYKLIELLL